MTIHSSPHRPTASDDRNSAQLGRFLYRPIVFQEPERVVHPGSWLEHAPFAFWIVDALRPAVFVELGTHSGNSYASFAQAVQTLGLSTSCYAIDTWQGDSQAGFYDEEVFTEWAAYHDRHFSAFSRLIRSTFAESTGHFPDGCVDLLHLDGCHTYEAASGDFGLWRPKLSRRGVMLIHDINVRERNFGTWRLWDELKTRFPFFEFLHGHGLGVLAAGSHMPEPLEWLFSRSSACPADVGAIRQFFARAGGVVSARFALAQAGIHARETQAQTARRLSDLENQLTREREEHDAAARHQWRVAARLQELVRHEQQHGRQVEAERDRAVSEIALQQNRLSITTSDLEARLTRLQDRLSVATSELEARAAQTAALEDQLKKDAESLDRKRRLAVDLLERLRAESKRRREIEAARDQLNSELSQRLNSTVRQRIERARSGARKRLRYLRTRARTPAALGLLPTSGHGISRAAVSFMTRPARLREAHAILASGLFDEAYYRRSYPDVAASRLTPVAHFVLKGGQEGRSPHPLFDTTYYLRSNPDVAAAAVNPLLHYRREGAFEGRKPHPLFDPAYYLDHNPDVRKAGVEPLGHFLRFGAADGRNPNPFFDCAYYLRQYPDVAAAQINPLVHFVLDGWREGRKPSPIFDTAQYLAEYADIRQLQINPLAHYLEAGRSEGRRAGADLAESERAGARDDAELLQVRLKVNSLASRSEPPTVLCLSHVMPLPPRAGNEYRIYRMLCWLRDQGYRIVPVIAPLPGERVESSAVRALADQFSNAILCERDGRLEYVLRDVPDVLASLAGEFTKPVSLLLDEDSVPGGHEQQLLQMDRIFCHDALITAALRLSQVLRPSILLAEYIWMSRILPLISSDVLKVIDTIDVFSTKREKVLQFGIDDLHVEAHEEARRLRHADLILAIQEGERQELEALVPEKRVVTAGVDFDAVVEAAVPTGRRVLYVASDNPMNKKGLLDFLRFAWPQVRRKVPDAELILAGTVSNVLDTDTPGVIKLGPVVDLKPLYGQARIVINPAVAGTGLKIKTLEAVTHLRPVVTWPTGTDGLPAELAAFCTIVEDWFEFSGRVADLLAADEPRLFTKTERETIVRLTSPTATYGPMTDTIGALLIERRGSDVAGPAIAG